MTAAAKRHFGFWIRPFAGGGAYARHLIDHGPEGCDHDDSADEHLLDGHTPSVA